MKISWPADRGGAANFWLGGPRSGDLGDRKNCYFAVIFLIKITTYFSKSASASGGLCPSNPLPGIVGFGDEVPQKLRYFLKNRY